MIDYLALYQVMAHIQFLYTITPYTRSPPDMR